jgi:hypothetical protein
MSCGFLGALTPVAALVPELALIWQSTARSSHSPDDDVPLVPIWDWSVAAVRHLEDECLQRLEIGGVTLPGLFCMYDRPGEWAV